MSLKNTKTNKYLDKAAAQCEHEPFKEFCTTLHSFGKNLQLRVVPLPAAVNCRKWLCQRSWIGDRWSFKHRATWSSSSFTIKTYSQQDNSSNLNASNMRLSCCICAHSFVWASTICQCTSVSVQAGRIVINFAINPHITLSAQDKPAHHLAAQ